VPGGLRRGLRTFRVSVDGEMCNYETNMAVFKARGLIFDEFKLF
jgi:hypothetical protein